MGRFDVIIVGGGPAGLTAALVLGRCRRRICVIDAGAPRNAHARAAHGVFTRDGTPPKELLRIARDQLVPYDVRIHDDEVTAIKRDSLGFVVTTRGGLVLEGKKLLLATGMRDRIPEQPGFRELVGRGVYVCPYCDGWENRDRRLAAYAPAAAGAELALSLRTWSDDVILVTPGETMSPPDRDELARNGIPVHADDVTSLDVRGGSLRGLVLRSGAHIERDAIFVKFGEVQAAPFAEELGCQFADNNTVCPNDKECAGTPGVFGAGDVSHDLQLISIALAEGVKVMAPLGK